MFVVAYNVLINILINESGSITPTEKPATKCEIKYRKVGCFKDDTKEPRPLPEMIMTDRDEESPVTSGKTIEWKAWDKYVPDVVCRCAQKALDKKYSIFGIQSHGKLINIQYTICCFEYNTHFL